jgi:hypothetical protein
MHILIDDWSVLSVSIKSIVQTQCESKELTKGKRGGISDVRRQTAADVCGSNGTGALPNGGKASLANQKRDRGR